MTRPIVVMAMASTRLTVNIAPGNAVLSVRLTHSRWKMAVTTASTIAVAQPPRNAPMRAIAASASADRTRTRNFVAGYRPRHRPLARALLGQAGPRPP